MLHCASVAGVPRPLALVAGVLPVAPCGVGVAQKNGVTCAPEITGPLRGALVIVSLAARAGIALGNDHVVAVGQAGHEAGDPAVGATGEGVGDVATLRR